jgi:hypothetical protein
MKVWVAEKNFDPNGQYDDYDLLRFCRARKFVAADVKLMFSNFMKWRAENSLDTLLDSFEE